MTSKWILELSKEIADDERFDRRPSRSLEIFERIDKLLRRAMLSTDDEFLHDDIEKETKQD